MANPYGLSDAAITRLNSQGIGQYVNMTPAQLSALPANEAYNLMQQISPVINYFHSGNSSSYSPEWGQLHKFVDQITTSNPGASSQYSQMAYANNASDSGGLYGAVFNTIVPGLVIGGIGAIAAAGIAGAMGAASASAAPAAETAGTSAATTGAAASSGTASQIAASLQVANPALSASEAMTAANAYVSAGYSAADISAVTIGNMGIDSTAALQFANAGYTPAQVSTMLANGAVPADFVGMGQGLAGLSSGAAASPSLLSKIGSFFTGSGTSGVPLGTATTGASLLSQMTGLSGSALGAIGSGIASLYGAQMSADSAKQAANISAQTSADVLAQQKSQFDIGQANEKPWLTAGQGALSAQQDLMGLGPNGAAGQMTALQSDPGYQFRLDNGNRSLDAGLAARGGMGSGKSLTAGVDYNQNFASNEYGNRLTQLASLSGTGQAAASGMANQGTNYANTVGNVMTNAGNNQANAGIAAGNATQSGILGAGTALNNYLNPPANQSSLMQSLFR